MPLLIVCSLLQPAHPAGACSTCDAAAAGFDALARLTALEELNVGYTAAPQASVLQWTTLKRLRVLSLDSCAVEDRHATLLP